MTTTRRTFLQKAALTAGAGLALPQLMAHPVDASLEAVLADLQGKTILFQGDSITDAGRGRDNKASNNPKGLGSGYAGIIAAHLTAKYPTQGIQVYNRGISGHKVFQLADRWQEDCFDLKPDVLSILIGVNDYWHTLNKANPYQGTVEVYEKDFRALLDRTFMKIPNLKLLICEPFMVKGGKAITEVWHTDFPPYQAAARRIATDYGATWVPFQAVFDKALTQAGPEVWCPDGVHPSPAGNQIMADAWLKGLKKTK